MSKITAEYFIQKLAPIPEKKWIIGQLESSDGEGKCTAGWLGGYFSPDASILGRMFTKHLSKQIEDPEILEELRENPYEIVFDVNDSNEFYGLRIVGSTPKERVMNLLYQIRKKELQDGNVATAKKIISTPKFRTNDNETSLQRQSGCVTTGR